LKPSNILVNGSGVLKYCDFGHSRKIDTHNANTHRNDDSSNSSKRGQLATWSNPGAGLGFGSPCYMAPELFEEGVHSFQSDFWSLGCVLYELAAGHPPFVSTSFEELVNMILNQPLIPIPGLFARLRSPNEYLLTYLFFSS
jgi:serine/threonine-protein kinase ULK4